jgi:hypothetical protein
MGGSQFTTTRNSSIVCSSTVLQFTYHRLAEIRSVVGRLARLSAPRRQSPSETSMPRLTGTNILRSSIPLSTSQLSKPHFATKSTKWLTSAPILSTQAIYIGSRMGSAALSWVVLGAVVATRASGAAPGLSVARCSCRRGISDEEGVNPSPVARLGLGSYRRLANIHRETLYQYPHLERQEGRSCRGCPRIRPAAHGALLVSGHHGWAATS